MKWSEGDFKIFCFLATILKDFLGNGDSDDESDGEDVDRFSVKPQFQGEQGQKVFILYI